MTTQTVSSISADFVSRRQNVSTHAYRPDIDGLRAFAVIFVIIFHAFPETLPRGYVGVDVFFVISGFLIGGIILRDLAKEKFSFFTFYARRILRIFPALALVLVTVFVAGHLLFLNDEYEMLVKHIFSGVAFISNFVYYSETGYWDVNSNLKPLLHLWSLGIEEQFYIIIPIVLAVAWAKKYRLPRVILFLLLVSFVWNIYYYRRNQELDFYMPFTRFWEIFIGVALAALAGYGKQLQYFASKTGGSRFKPTWNIAAKDDWRHARQLLSILGAICLIVAVLVIRNRNFPGHRALWPTLGAAFIIASGPGTWLNRRIFSNRIAVGIGLISYPLYLWHWPLLSFAAILNGKLSGERQWWHIRLVCVLISVVLAFLTYVLVERPLRFGKGGKKIKVYVLAALMGCIGIAGSCILLLGVPERSFMESYQKRIDGIKGMGGLANPIATDDSILQYIPGAADWPWGYHRYRNTDGKRTVAVMGDSHAPPVFQGMMEKNQLLGVNTVMLGYSPQSRRREIVLAAIKSKEDITDVFIAMRGVLYLAGVDLDADNRGNGELHDEPGWNFAYWMQALVDELRGVGKQVYILSENPVFPYQPQALFRRPFFNFLEEPSIVVSKEDVYAHQKEYLDMLSGIQGAEIINGIDIFCRDNVCSMLSEDGIPLYADDDHLSVYGGRYLVENLLMPYLSAIAARGEGEQSLPLIGECSNPPDSPARQGTVPAVP